MRTTATTNRSSDLKINGSPLRSSVSVGLACGAPFQASQSDCIVAYVDRDDPKYSVQIALVYGVHDAATNTWSPTVTPGVTLNVSTVSDIAAWYHDGRFWLAVRRPDDDEPAEVLHSVDGVIWSAGPLLGTALMGPSAQSVFTGGGTKIFKITE